MKRTQHLALGSHQPWMKRAVESWSKLNPDVVGFYHVFRFCPGQGGKLLGKTIGKRAWESYLVWQKLVLVCSHMPPREVLTRAKKKKENTKCQGGILTLYLRCGDYFPSSKGGEWSSRWNAWSKYVCKKKNNNLEKKKKKKFKEGLWINRSLFPDLKAEYSHSPSSAKVMAQFP